MADYKNDLNNRLYEIAGKLRSNMDANEYKNYILGFIFYKYLSEKVELTLNKKLENDNINFEEAFKNNDSELQEILEQESVTILGYFIEPKYLFSTLVKEANKGTFILNDLKEAFTNIEESALKSKSNVFDGLFHDVDLDSQKLGKDPTEVNKKISEIFFLLSKIDFELEKGENDILGDAYEFLIGKFASEAGKKAGEFYTPQEVSTVLARIVSLNKEKLKAVYDPTCGSGSLLLRVAKEMGDVSDVGTYCGQELNQTTYNLARMNMILHNVDFDDFDIRQGDSIKHPHFINKKFEAIVANPPFSQDWSADKSYESDPRFSAYGKLPPKSKEDYAFVEHMIYHLDENGTMAVVLPHGTLFRGASELKIRKYLVEEKNYLDAVIGLPAKLFYGTTIPTCVLVFKKCREEDESILFIDASKNFEKVGKQNKLRQEDINKILETYKNREEIEKYSHNAPLKEIEENEYNLNIPRYVDTFEEEKPIDINKVHYELKEISQELKKVDNEIEKYCNELGIESPIY